MGQAGDREDAAGGGRTDALVIVQLSVCWCELRTGGEAEREERKGRERTEARGRERERERQWRGRKRHRKKEKEKSRARGGEGCCRGMARFGNSRGAAILGCGESASGSQEANGRPVPGHNDSLSVALTRSGLSTPRNTKFTQAQNAAPRAA